MITFSIKRITTIAATVTCAAAISSSCFAESFDDVLGNFAQRASGVCVIYAHVMAVAETDHSAITKMVRKVHGGWMVDFSDGRRTYVPQSILDKSLASGFSCGEPENALTIASMALSMRSGGFQADTGQLDYGPVEFWRFLGTGKWTLYDDGQIMGCKLTDGFNRLMRETGPDGKPKVPCTMGFGSLDEKSVPKYAEQIKKLNLLGGHDYSVSSFDANNQIVKLRNPHRPKEIMNIPLQLLRNIPCGIDFMETTKTEASACKAP